MNLYQFKQFLNKVEELNTVQKSQLRDRLTINDERSSIQNLETNFSELSCPHCQSKEVGHWGQRNNLRRYRCRSCKKTFNSLTGTPLAGHRKKHLWESFAEGMLEQESLSKASERLKINNRTAFKWRHVFLKNAKSIKPEQLSGVVENDETFFLESAKGCRLGLSRPARKRAGKATKRGVSKQQVCVFVSRDRNGNTYDEIFENFNAAQLTKKFVGHLANDVIFYSDGSLVYKKFAKQNDIKHEALNLSKGERVRDKVIHIQNINAYHSRLKSWVENFRGVATKYLDSYLAWFRAIEEPHTNFTPQLIVARAKSGGKYNYNP